MKESVLIVVPSLRMGGMEKEAVLLANSLAEKGYEVELYNLTYHDDGIRSQLVSSVLYSCQNAARNLGTHKRLLPFDIWIKVHSPEFIYKRMVKKHYDVAVAFFRGVSVKIVSGAPKETKKLAWIHNDYTMCDGYQNGFKNRSEMLESYSQFQHIVCVSDDVRKSFLKVIGTYDSLCVVYNLIDAEEIRRKSLEKSVSYDGSGIQIVCVGRLTKVKGFDRLIEAIYLLQKDGIECALYIVGDGPEKESLESIIETKKLKNCQLLGYQLNPYPYIKSADVLVCSSYYEGYNLTIAEAMVLGVPVLSTRCSGPCEILGDGQYGMLVDNNMESIYKGLKEITSSPALLSELSKKARERWPFFDKDTILGQIEELMQI